MVLQVLKEEMLKKERVVVTEKRIDLSSNWMGDYYYCFGEEQRQRRLCNPFLDMEIGLKQIIQQILILSSIHRVLIEEYEAPHRKHKRML